MNQFLFADILNMFDSKCFELQVALDRGCEIDVVHRINVESPEKCIEQ